ncbi:MAG TPA: hypothetical protein VNQ73_17325 [Ilumatobacter sp.]|nr:hypothetical protein [Ilumatobacter sp.]
MHTWAAVLDDLERRIVAQEAALGLVDDGVWVEPDELRALAVFTPPAGLPALPAEHAQRAQQLLDRTHRVQDGLANVIETTRPARLARPRPAGVRGAGDLDVRA